MYSRVATRLKVLPSTMSTVLKKFRNILTIYRKIRSGENQGVKDPNVNKNVSTVFMQNPKFPIRDIDARKVKMSSSYVQKLKRRAGLKSFKA